MSTAGLSKKMASPFDDTRRVPSSIIRGHSGTGMRISSLPAPKSSSANGGSPFFQNEGFDPLQRPPVTYNSLDEEFHRLRKAYALPPRTSRQGTTTSFSSQPPAQPLSLPEPVPMLEQLQQDLDELHPRMLVSYFLNQDTVLAMHRREVLERDQKETMREEMVKSQDGGKKLTVFGVPLCQVNIYASHTTVVGDRYHDIPFVVYVCIEELYRTGLYQQSLFRSLPNRSRLHELIHIFNTSQPELRSSLPFHTNTPLRMESMPNVCALLFTYLSQLPEPILTPSIYTSLWAWCVSGDLNAEDENYARRSSIYGNPSIIPFAPIMQRLASSDSYNSATGETPRMSIAQHLLHLLPTPNFSLLVYLLMFFSQVVMMRDENGMSVSDVGDMFGLHICGLIRTNQTQECGEDQEKDGQQEPRPSLKPGNIHDKTRAKLTLCWLLNRWGWIAERLFELRDQYTPEALLEKAEAEKREAEEEKARRKSKKLLVGLVSLCKAPGSPASLCKTPESPSSKTPKMSAGGDGGFSPESSSTTPRLPELNPISPFSPPMTTTPRQPCSPLNLSPKVDGTPRAINPPYHPIRTGLEKSSPHQLQASPFTPISPLQLPPLSNPAVQSPRVYNAAGSDAGGSPTKTGSSPRGILKRSDSSTTRAASAVDPTTSVNVSFASIGSPRSPRTNHLSPSVTSQSSSSSNTTSPARRASIGSGHPDVRCGSTTGGLSNPFSSTGRGSVGRSRNSVTTGLGIQSPLMEDVSRSRSGSRRGSECGDAAFSGDTGLGGPSTGGASSGSRGLVRGGAIRQSPNPNQPRTRRASIGCSSTSNSPVANGRAGSGAQSASTTPRFTQTPFNLHGNGTGTRGVGPTSPVVLASPRAAAAQPLRPYRRGSIREGSPLVQSFLDSETNGEQMVDRPGDLDMQSVHSSLDLEARLGEVDGTPTKLNDSVEQLVANGTSTSMPESLPLSSSSSASVSRRRSLVDRAYPTNQSPTSAVQNGVHSSNNPFTTNQTPSSTPRSTGGSTPSSLYQTPPSTFSSPTPTPTSTPTLSSLSSGASLTSPDPSSTQGIAQAEIKKYVKLLQQAQLRVHTLERELERNDEVVTKAIRETFEAEERCLKLEGKVKELKLELESEELRTRRRDCDLVPRVNGITTSFSVKRQEEVGSLKEQLRVVVKERDGALALVEDVRRTVLPKDSEA
ncbi:hypothetical protein BDN72DRAFT_842981 [Pluteus cervinus]|uniref:Uncharacterized protein n=1 Tax=Pluteus cervinus TaxID=181527 RepID=A0ACD3APB3_9AGAR|nr:hypothetical protein BDN72DRAFT_842981 [Pluteus cervinus]